MLVCPFKIAVNPLPSKFQKGRNKNRAVAIWRNRPVLIKAEVLATSPRASGV